MPHPYFVSFLFIPSLYPSLFNSKKCLFYDIILYLLEQTSGIVELKDIRASVDALCRDGAGLISRERVQRGRLTRQGTTS